MPAVPLSVIASYPIDECSLEQALSSARSNPFDGTVTVTDAQGNPVGVYALSASDCNTAAI